jgi:hypothetical protein
MRVKLFTFLSVSVATVVAAFLAASLLSASALAASGDSNFGIRGSLGASLSELSLDTGGGTWAFLLNAAFAVAFLIGAHLMTRDSSQQSGPPRGRFSGLPPQAYDGRIYFRSSCNTRCQQDAFT